MTVIVKKIGGSMAVIIPKTLVNEMGLIEGTSLDVSGGPTEIVMRRHGRRPRRPIAELVAQMNPAAYRRLRKEFPDSGPVGKEYW